MESKKMRRISSNSESGVILPIVIILMLAITITGLAFLNAGVMENSLARREIHKNQAFYLAEAGLERTLWNLKQDFVNDEDWTNGINGVSVGDPNDGWGLLQYGESPHESPLGAGFYLVELRYVFTGGVAEKDEIWVRSTGTEDVENISKTVQIYVRMENVFPWNNAIFAGIGAAGQAISGNANIYGSVHIIGSPGETVVAMDTFGTAGIRNNYENMPVELVAKVPQCPTTTFNGEIVESLDAKLRVKHGIVGLSGNAIVGETDEILNLFKETMDGVYVTDGFGGNQGADNVHSDNGSGNPYDLGDTVGFPSLKDNYVNPDTGEEVLGYPYLNWLHDNSLHITAADWENNISFGIPEISSNIETFERGALGSNYIKWDKESGLLTIDGIISIDGELFHLGKIGGTIEYSGSGTVVVAEESGGNILGDIRVHGNLLAEGEAEFGGGFPHHALGLIAGNLYLATGEGESQLTMTGAFFAENEIVSAKQNEIAGTFVSNYFDVGGQVPSIYQVPELATNLPPGMPGGTPNWYITTSQWTEV